ncbi:MAG TPA: hypothetical protein VM661_09950 [Candidatus Sulfotelmatobacter sp.]|jgi:hypothetical protein|nr:hypothetical protein [Candidatus Sulfotelmatobacter sp.]
MSIGQKCTTSAERLKNIRTGFRDTLASFVGVGRSFAVDDVAKACGKSPDTIHSYLRGQTVPDWPTAVLLLGLLSVEFATIVLRPAGLAGVHRISGVCPPGETLREIIEGAATLATAWADQRIDHTEWPEVEKQLTEAQTAIAQFLATKGDQK